MEGPKQRHSSGKTLKMTQKQGVRSDTTQLSPGMAARILGREIWSLLIQITPLVNNAEDLSARPTHVVSSIEPGPGECGVTDSQPASICY